MLNVRLAHFDRFESKTQKKLSFSFRSVSEFIFLYFCFCFESIFFFNYFPFKLMCICLVFVRWMCWTRVSFCNLVHTPMSFGSSWKFKFPIFPLHFLFAGVSVFHLIVRLWPVAFKWNLIVNCDNNIATQTKKTKTKNISQFRSGMHSPHCHSIYWFNAFEIQTSKHWHRA